MKFTFKNYFRFLDLRNLLLSLVYTILFFFVFIIFTDCIGKYILLTILLILILITPIIILIRRKRLNFFLKCKSSKEISQMEKYLNNPLLNYNDWFFTDEYIFLADKLELINYDDIVSVSYNFKINWLAPYKSIDTIFSYQFNILLKSGKHYYFKISITNVLVRQQFKNIMMNKNRNACCK